MSMGNRLWDQLVNVSKGFKTRNHYVPEGQSERKEPSKRRVGTTLSVDDRGNLQTVRSSARGRASDIHQSNEGESYADMGKETKGTNSDESERDGGGSDWVKTGDNNMEPCDAESSEYYMWNGE